MEHCDYPLHAACMDEAGFCPVCQQGEVDLEWAERNELDLSLEEQ